MAHRLKINRDQIMELLATVVVWLAFMKDAISEQSHVVLTGIGVVFSGCLLTLCIAKYKINRKVFVLFGFAALFGAINIGLIGSLTFLNYIPMLFFYFPISVYLKHCNKLNTKWWEINYYIYSAYILYRMINAVGGYYLFYASSRNTLSVFLLIWALILFVAFRKNGKILPIRVIIMFFIGCILATGRGGIVSGVILLGSYWILDMRDNAHHRKIKYQVRWIAFALVTIIAVLYVVGHIEGITSQYLFRFTDDVSLRSGNARLYAWDLYISRCKDPWNFIFGANTYTLLPPAYAGNLHNSMLMVHARFGIVGFVFVLYIFIASMIDAIRKTELRLFFLIVVIFVRSMTDQIFPAKIGDIALWIIAFELLYRKDKKFFLYKKRMKPKGIKA